MTKDWITFDEWLKYEWRVFRRARREINLVTLICALVGSGTGYSAQYLTGLKQAHEVFPIAGLMLGGAVFGFLFHFTLLVLTTPAKLDAEAEARAQNLENEIESLKRAEEEEQKLRRRRASGPFLKPIDEDWIRLFIRTGPGQYSMIPYGHPALLCASMMEVKDLKDGESVFFPFEHEGADVSAVSLKLDGAPAALEKEPKLDGASGFYYFTYPYIKAKHGQKQILSMSFERSDGQHDTHQYVTLHGHRILKRIDPPLPSSN